MSDELQRLIRQYVEQDISSEDFDTLRVALQSDNNARQQFVDYMNLCHALDEHALALAEAELAPFLRPSVVLRRDATMSWPRLLALGAAACLVLSVIAVALDTTGIVDIFGSGSDNRLAAALVKRGLGVQTTLDRDMIYSSQDLPDEDFFIREINFYNRDGDPFPINRDDLARWLPPLERLEVLDFTGCAMTDDCIPLLVAQPSLQQLKLGSSSGLTTAGLQQLAESKRLSAISVADAGEDTWRALATIQTLQDIDIWGSVRTPSDQVIPHLKQLPHLRRLNAGISRTWDDRALIAITELPALRWFGVQYAPLTDTGLADFVTQIEQSHHPLEGLYLEYCPGLTSQAITSLGRLDQLRSLGLKGSPFTPAEIDRLRDLLPNTHVDF